MPEPTAQKIRAHFLPIERVELQCEVLAAGGDARVADPIAAARSDVTIALSLDRIVGDLARE
ncbi:MAG: hypothetical protein ACR2NR_07930 [Solirubrobacteraceae bacterium]